MSEFTLEELAAVVASRAGSSDSGSYTAALIGKGPVHCAKKFGEEAIEAVIAAIQGDRAAIRAEAADVLYHLLVVLHVAGVSFDEVKAELKRRTRQTGLEERAARSGAA
jgi:phosphoribosyl-ATP pyrophosphohydrolase